MKKRRVTLRAMPLVGIYWTKWQKKYAAVRGRQRFYRQGWFK